MTMSPEEAAEVARAHGLTIADAVSLRVLADDRAQAEAIAATFATADATENASRDLARRIFADAPAPIPPEGPSLQDFTRALFQKEAPQ